jgi:branched-chain amino acid transport system permease protein
MLATVFRKSMRKKRIVLISELILLALLLLFVNLFGSYYVIWIVGLAVIYSSYTLAWNFLRVTVGRVSLGHSIPFGLAGYLSAIYYLHSNSLVFIPLMWILAGIISGIILYLLSLSRDRVAFVFITFLLGTILWILSPLVIIKRESGIYGGEEGFVLPTIPVPATYSASVLILLTLFLSIGFFRTSLTGIRFKTVAEDERAARTIGVRVDRVKLYSSFFSTILTSVAGGLYSLHFSHVNPEVFSIHVALFPFIATVFFKDSEIGSVIGSFILVFALNYLNSIFPQLHLLLYAILLIVSPALIRRVRGD